MILEKDSYRFLIENLPDAFAYHQIVLDKHGAPVDYVFLDINRAFEKMTALKREELIGKKVTEILPGMEKSDFDWIGTYGRAALNCETTRFESFSEPLGRWYAISAYSDKPGYFGVFFRDISERKQAEEALKESEAKDRLLTDNMGDVVWTMDLDLKATYISPSCKKIFGYTPEERLQQTIEQRMTPESTALMISRLQEEIAKENEGKGNQDRSMLIEGEYYHKNGSTIWMESLVKALRDPSGKIIGICGASRDITERKKTEMQIEKMAEIVDIAPNSITVHDTEGNFLYANERTFSMHGYNKDEFLGLTLKELDAPESAEHIAPRMKEIEEKGEASFEVKHRRKNGSTFPLQIFVKKIDWFGQLALLSIATDITDRKIAEEALQERETRFQRILKVIPDMVSVHDPNMNIVYSNWSGFAAVPPEKQVLNTKCYKTYRDYNQICPDCQAVSVLDSKEAFHAEVELSKGFWIDLRVIPLLDNSGEVEYFIEWVRDVSDLKKIEKQLREFNVELEEKVRERTIQLEAVNKELESFAYSVSHDLRAPLRALDGFSANLQAKYDDQLDKQGRHYLNRIHKAALYMSDLIDDLLNLSRVTRTELKKQQVDLSKLAAETIAALLEAEPQRKARIKISPGLSAWGDAALLRVVMENLLGNAWKFSTKAKETRIEVGRNVIEGEEVFFIRDNGAGFDMIYADKLFKPFQRLHGVEEFPGTGVGLATVQRVINRHGGKIWAEGNVGKGATFYFTLGSKKGRK
jgi:PAS domain S-box-containing protein